MLPSSNAEVIRVFADPVRCWPVSSPQPHHLSGCSGGHLRHFCNVLRSSQLRPVFDPGEGHTGKASAVCQWCQSFGLLDGQLPLGHGAVTTLPLWEAYSNLSCVVVLWRFTPPCLILSSPHPPGELFHQCGNGGGNFHFL